MEYGLSLPCLALPCIVDPLFSLLHDTQQITNNHHPIQSQIKTSQFSQPKELKAREERSGKNHNHNHRMGNTMTLGKRRTAKVMKIDGGAFKIKTPVRAGSVLENYPGHVLLESEAVKHYGVRAKPLEPQQELKPRRLYFLVEMPKLPEDKSTRRVKSGIQMSAKDRLESLMLARRSSSDLTILKQPSIEAEENGGGGSGLRVRMRLPKAEVDRLIAESKDGADVAEKIISLCRTRGAAANVGDTGDWGRDFQFNGDHGVARRGVKPREKRVGFMPISETEIQQIGVAS